MTEVGRRSPAKAAAAWAVFFAAGNVRVDLGDCLKSVRLAAERQGRLGETDLALCQRVRDVLGNPFRSHAVGPTWRTWKGHHLATLARAAYDNRRLTAGTLDNARLAEIAEALTEAGCTDADLLEHCRRPGEHVRGCWVLDLLLGQS